jgi:hypothetical protein
VDFRWNDWNLEHATRHGCSVAEIESVIRAARRPYPRRIDRSKWQVIGRGQGDRFIQIAYVIDSGGSLYVIHAMPLSTRRRRRRF